MTNPKNLNVTITMKGALAPQADIGKLNLPNINAHETPNGLAGNSNQTFAIVSFNGTQTHESISNRLLPVNFNYQKPLAPSAKIENLQLPSSKQATILNSLPGKHMPPGKITVAPNSATINLGDGICEQDNKVYYKKGETMKMLLNFTIRLVKKISFKDIDGKTTSKIEICVLHDGKQQNLVLPEYPRNKYFENIQKNISGVFKGTDVTDRENKIDIYFSKIFERQIDVIPHTQETEYVGWEKLNGQMRYSHGGLPDVYSTKVVPPLDGQNMAAVFRGGFDFLTAGKVEKLLPIFLFPALGITYKLFEDAGRYAPRFVLFIRGRTGSFKTELANLLFNVFETNADAKNVDFNATLPGMEHASRAANDSTLWVDDFRPPQTTKEKNDSKEKLEFLVRRYGDKSARAKSAPDGKNLKKIISRGCCGITGEFVEGSHSSLLRMVQVELRRGDVDSETLGYYQKNENNLLLPRFYGGLVSFLENHYDSTVAMIQSLFDSLRNKYSGSFEDHRLTDSLVCYILMAKIILIYGIKTGALTQSQATEIHNVWEKVLFNAIDFNAINSNLLNPQTMYLQAISELLGDNTIRLAKSLKEFETNRYNYVGYEEDNKMLFVPKDLYAKIKTYWEQMDQPLTIKPTELHKLLKETNISIVSKGRNLYRSSAAGRNEMLCLDKHRFEEEVGKIRHEPDSFM